MRICQFVPYLHAPGDAVANQVYAFQQIFDEGGYQTDIFALEGDADISGLWKPVSKYLTPGKASDKDVLLYHYVIGSPLTALLKTAPGRLVIFYHNITPPEYVQLFHRGIAASLWSGRQELQTLCHAPALVPSDYSRQELFALGFQHVQVVPLILDMERLHASAHTPAGRALVEQYSDGSVNWVSIGRIAPNKCCEDIIKSFAYYQRFINARARLFLVGSIQHFEAYQFNLARLIERWDVREVHWCGQVAYEDGFGAYYQLASVLVHMSEHEGFCAPLLEAMSFDVPVLAYCSSAVPFTMGNAGVLVHTKRYVAIAEMVNSLHCDEMLRAQIIATQRNRLDDFKLEQVAEQLLQALDWVIQG